MMRGLTVVLLCGLALLNTSCGFEPVYAKATRDQYNSQIESVQIVTDSGRLPQLLKAEIEDQVNPDARHAEKLFILTIHFTEVEISIFINPDGTSSRGDLQYRSSYALTRKLDGKLVDQGALTRISSYNVSETADYGTYVSREDARKRGVLSLAQDYKLRLANLLSKINDPNAKPNKNTEPKASEIPAFHQDNYETHGTGL